METSLDLSSEVSSLFSPALCVHTCVHVCACMPVFMCVHVPPSWKETCFHACMCEKAGVHAGSECSTPALANQIPPSIGVGDR